MSYKITEVRFSLVFKKKTFTGKYASPRVVYECVELELVSGFAVFQLPKSCPQTDSYLEIYRFHMCL